MALPDFTGQNIQDTYQRVVQKGANGQLFDGTGSAVPIKIEGNNVRISGSLIAQEYVVSSSVANITTQQLSGSTVFGNSSDDTHTFTGNITSSGNISSSGDVLATDFKLPTTEGGSLSTRNNGEQINLGEDFIDFGFGGSWQLELRKDEGVVLYDLANVSPLLSKDFRIEGNGDTHLFFVTGGDARIGIGTSTPSSKLEVSGDINTTSHITASGNISSSGDIFADNVTIDNDYSGRRYTSTAEGFYQNSIKLLDYSAGVRVGNTSGNSGTEVIGSSVAGIKLTGDVTASANISASGNILTSGNISALETGSFGKVSAAKISSSGDVIGNNANFQNLRSEALQIGRVTFASTNGLLTDDQDFSFSTGTNTLSVTNIANVSTTHVTASGEISASGDIFGSDYHGHGDNRIIASAFTQTTFGRTDNKTEIDGTNIKLDAPVTASGNISASGTVNASSVRTTDVKVDATSGGGVVFKDTTETNVGTIVYTEGGVRITPVNANPAGAGFLVVSGSGGALSSNALIGIGKETPEHMLDVAGNVNSSGTFTSRFGASGSINSTGSFGSLLINAGNVDFTGIPTSDPGVAGRLFRDGTDLKISTG